MLTPYVQDVSKWINYYNRHGTSNVNVAKPTENQHVAENTGMAQESTMSVNKVEPRGPPPPAPHTGPSASLQNVTPSHESVVQAAYTAKRVQIENNQLKGRKSGKNGKTKKKKKKIGKGGGGGGGGVHKLLKKNTKKKYLFGTPGDIFKSKNNKKKKN